MNFDAWTGHLRGLNVERAVLIGHSRGGLVARHAAEITRSENPNVSIRCVTLGTPSWEPHMPAPHEPGCSASERS